MSELGDRLRAFAIMADEGRMDKRDLIDAFDAWDPLTLAMRDIKYPWRFSALHGSVSTYGFYCIIDRSKPGTGGHSPGDLECVIGHGEYPAAAVRDAVDKTKGLK